MRRPTPGWTWGSHPFVPGLAGGTMNTHKGSRRKPFWIIYASFLVAALALSSKPAAAQTCEKLSGLKLANTTITSAQSVAAGEFPPPSGPAAPYKELPAFCRVTGVIRPTTDSEIKFEVWMPSSGWNGKFQGIGNGGVVGWALYCRGAGGARG